MRQKKLKDDVIAEYLNGGVTLRELGAKYRVNFRTIHRWVKAYEDRREGTEGVETRLQAMSGMPEDVKKLQRELYEERLRTRLLETMIDIAEKEMGIPIRKKSGAK